MKTRRPNAKDRADFAAKALEVIRQAGGREEPDDTGLYSWIIPETKCGPLYLHVVESFGIALGFVAGRFVYPERAVAVLGVGSANPYSGKWNHHYWGTGKVNVAVAEFSRSLGRVLVAKEEQRT